MIPADPTFEHLSLSAKQRVDAVCARFEAAWRDGRPDMEGFLAGVPEDERPVLLLELLMIELECRRHRGETPTLEEYLARFPAHAAILRIALRSPALETNPDGMLTQDSGSPSNPPLGVPGYQLMHELGRGGMGVVYCARHMPLNRVVALKFILPGRQGDAQQRDRFRQEAEVVARLRHPNIVQIYEIGETPNGCFLALEYADGGNLRARLTGSPLNPNVAARLLEPLVRAVMHAHRHGVIHRDIKPANVLLIVSGDSIAADNQPLPETFTRGETLKPKEQASLRECTPKLTDFGLARLLEGDGPVSMESGVAAGTPAYMAPEQASGEAACTPSVDIWALGATLYEMLTGKPPFKGPSARETMRLVLWEEPVAPRAVNPAVPAELERICLKCLHKDPEKRYVTARDLANDLHRFLSGPPRRARRWWPWLALAGVGVAAAAYAAWRLLRG
jgi:serine/threonine protein kinase